MATSTYLSNCRVQVGNPTANIDITDQCSGAAVTIGYDPLVTDAFGKNYHSNTSGLQANEVQLDLYASFAASETYATLKSLVGVGTCQVIITPDPDSPVGATNPAMTFSNTMLAALPLVTSIGALGTYSVTFLAGEYTEDITP